MAASDGFRDPTAELVYDPLNLAMYGDAADGFGAPKSHELIAPLVAYDEDGGPTRVDPSACSTK